MNSSGAKDTLKKKLLFAEVLHQQLKKIILVFEIKKNIQKNDGGETIVQQ